jgi:chemosensory pili system protein ChpC
MNARELKCVILTMRKENVIMPNSLVAEIVSVKDVSEKSNTPDWYLGKMNWRGIDIPLLSFEAAAGDSAAKVNLNTQAVVFYAVGNSDEISDTPYLALVMSGVPHVSVFGRDQIVTDTDANNANEHPMIAQKVRINGASVSVLDVDAMAEMVSGLAA